MGSKSRRKVPFTIYVDPADLAALRKLSAESGIAIATFVRRAVALTMRDTARAAKALGVTRMTLPTGGAR